MDSAIGAESAENAQLLLEEGLPQETQAGSQRLSSDSVYVHATQATRYFSVFES